jgi:xylan 1,4-beta-xylosidase
MRSKTLTDDESAWEYLGNFFNESDPKRGSALYRVPNHCSPAVMAGDSTWWVIYQSYGTNEWEGLGRQGLVSQVRYDADSIPVADFPINEPMNAPNLPSSGIPWMVPKTDFFDSDTLNPEWQLLGYSPTCPYSLTDRPGWIRLSPKNQHNTIIKNDAEHNYALITRLDFDPQSTKDEAGIRIMTGLQTLYAKLYSSVNSDGKKVICFSFDKTYYEVENTIGNLVWLRLFRDNHNLRGSFSADGHYWAQVGNLIKVSKMDAQQAEYNAFTGNRQGLYVMGSPADFDLYIYRDAYSPILAECPANQYGTLRKSTKQGYVLDNIHANDWAMYAGVEFGNNSDYDKIPDSLKVIASSATTGGTIEVWLDSLDTGAKIAECSIGNTGDWNTFQTFTVPVEPVSGRHDVYLKFTGTETDRLFQLQWLYFTVLGDTCTSVGETPDAAIPQSFGLEQNFPNPFNPATLIRFKVPERSFVSLKVYNLRGAEVSELAGQEFSAGEHSIPFDASQLSSGIYFYTLRANDSKFLETKKMVLIR